MKPHLVRVPSGHAGSAVSLIEPMALQRICQLLSVVSVAVLQACATTDSGSSSSWPWPDTPYSETKPGYGSSQAPVQESQRQSSSADTQRALQPRELAARSQVGQSLLVQAREQRVMGAYVDAAATLERAIGIDAQDPVLWWELARVRLEQNRLHDAENLSQRALEYAWPEDPIYAACWELIAQARELRGDQRGATQAREQARSRS